METTNEKDNALKGFIKITEPIGDLKVGDIVQVEIEHSDGKSNIKMIK